jgi:hypothetical protein
MVHAGTIDTISDQFFALLKQGETGKALDSLTAGNKWLEKDSDGLVGLRTNLARSHELFGQYLFHELISETHVGKHLLHRIYLVGYARQPISCRLTFYKPGTVEWRVQNISFGIDLVDNIGKQAETQILK